jgi:hypothetical protein
MHKYLPEKRTMAMMRKHTSRFQDENIGHHSKPWNIIKVVF